MDIFYKIKHETLTSFADQARRINGTTDGLTVDEMLTIFEGAGQGGSGGSSSGISGTYADQLYKFWSVDKETYPYLYAIINGSSARIVFAKSIYTNTAKTLQVGDPYSNAHLIYYVSSYTIETILDYADLKEVTSKLCVSGITLSSMTDTTNGQNTNAYLYTNFEANLTCKAKYNLNDEPIVLPYDGLANGYDVMFYDENNMGLAFYSIKQGHAINPPIYNTNNWKTSDGAAVTFPYTPTEDVIFYALNSTYADQLYEFYGVDKGVYPYLAIMNRYNSSASYFYSVQVCFAKGLSDSKLQNVDIYYVNSTTKLISDFSDSEAVTIWVMENVSRANIETHSTLTLVDTYSSSTKYEYQTNFDFVFNSAKLYRLDE